MNKISFYVIALVIVFGGYLFFSRDKSDMPISTQEVKKEQSVGTSNTPKLSATSSDIKNNNLEVNKKIMSAILQTNKGNITIEFNIANAPNTVANFIKLAKAGFYDGTKFHRVIKDFMSQGGDPLTKDDSQIERWGTGGPGYKFDNEIGPDNHNDIGTVAMANSGPNTNGSQFFINAAANNYLDTGYTVFAKVISGIDVVALINSVKTNAVDRPIEPVILEKVILK